MEGFIIIAIQFNNLNNLGNIGNIFGICMFYGFSLSGYLSGYIYFIILFFVFVSISLYIF